MAKANRTCSIANCNKSVRCKGLCPSHYREALQAASLPTEPNPCDCGCGGDAGYYKSTNRAQGIVAGSPKKFIMGHHNTLKKDTAPCSIDGCESGRYAHGVCQFHYDRMRTRGTYDAPEGLVFNTGSKCLVEGCDRIEDTRGLCGAHYSRVKKFGDAFVFKPIRERRDLSSLPDNAGWCTKCDEIKPLDQFHKGQRQCKSCWHVWFIERREEIYARHRRHAREKYLEAKTEGRCTWRGGNGCQEPSRTGRVMCEAHGKQDSARSTKRATGVYDQSYAARGLSSCWICGSEFTESNRKHNDHLIPRSLGGPDDPWNMAPACARCNISRSNTPLSVTMLRATYAKEATSDFPDEYKQYLAAS